MAWDDQSRAAGDARRRPYHHGNLRQALLDAAEAAIEGAPPMRSRCANSAGRLGVSHTSAQRHFANRRDLLNGLAQRGFDRLGAALAEPVEARASSFDARLARLARAHVGFAGHHPALFRWMSEATGLADAPASLLAARDKAFAPASLIFADGQAAGTVVPGNPEQLGLASFAAVQALVALSPGGKFDGLPLDTLIGGVIERIILGLRP